MGYKMIKSISFEGKDYVVSPSTIKTLTSHAGWLRISEDYIVADTYMGCALVDFPLSLEEEGERSKYSNVIGVVEDGFFKDHFYCEPEEASE